MQTMDIRKSWKKSSKNFAKSTFVQSLRKKVIIEIKLQNRDCPLIKKMIAVFNKINIQEDCLF